MTVTVVVPVWGSYLQPWIDHGYPILARECGDAGAQLHVYTDRDGFWEVSSLRGIDSIRYLPTPEKDGLDVCDIIHRDLLDTAVTTGDTIVPLMAGITLSAGALTAAIARIEGGARAVMALTMVGQPPPNGAIVSAPAMVAWVRQQTNFTLWSQTPFSKHPGHLAWRSASGATLVRMLYINPIAIRPSRAFEPHNAVDHFMVEGYVGDFSKVAFLDPSEGMIFGWRPENTISADPRPRDREPDVSSPQVMADWALKFLKPWNLKYARHKFWLGDPGEDRAAVEAESDGILEEIDRLYAAGGRGE